MIAHLDERRQVHHNVRLVRKPPRYL